MDSLTNKKICTLWFLLLKLEEFLLSSRCVWIFGHLKPNINFFVGIFHYIITLYRLKDGESNQKIHR